MASISETGHAINIGKFKQLIDLVSAYSNYQPTNPKIFVAAMTAQWTAAEVLETALNSALMDAAGPINDREDVFEALNKTLTRTVNYYGSSGCSKKYADDAARIKKQITGVSKKKAVPVGEGEDQEIKRISNSHRSFLKKTENLETLISLYESDITYYIPNETALQTASLRTTLATVKVMNNAMNTLLDHIIVKRLARNYALYEEVNGIIDVAIACKKYVRGLFGASSQEARAVGDIQLKRFMRMEKV